VHNSLIYDRASDYSVRRGEFRSAHLKLAWESQQRSGLVIAMHSTIPPTARS
jgi:hypothetical protein